MFVGSFALSLSLWDFLISGAGVTEAGSCVAARVGIAGELVPGTAVLLPPACMQLYVLTCRGCNHMHKCLYNYIAARIKLMFVLRVSVMKCKRMENGNT